MKLQTLAAAIVIVGSICLTTSGVEAGFRDDIWATAKDWISEIQQQELLEKFSEKTAPVVETLEIGYEAVSDWLFGHLHAVDGEDPPKTCPYTSSKELKDTFLTLSVPVMNSITCEDLREHVSNFRKTLNIRLIDQTQTACAILDGLYEPFYYSLSKLKLKLCYEKELDFMQPTTDKD